MTAATKRFDVVIVGGGVSGTALAYTLSRYSSVSSIALVEKYGQVATVNSHPMNNSQTSHDGGTETNYDLDHALQVQRAASMLRRYVKGANMPDLYHRTSRMVLGIGTHECEGLRERFKIFSPHYPDLRLAECEEIAELEPSIVRGRKSSEDLCAIVSDDGYAINYQSLSQSFLDSAFANNPDIAMFFRTNITGVSRDDNGSYLLQSDRVNLVAKVVVFAAGPYSLLFAQELGLVKNLGILNVAGSFFSAGTRLNGKVYTVQIEGLPFAAIHGDPDILNPSDTRFGPTTKPLPLMERHRYRTILDYVRLPIVSVRGVLSLLKILRKHNLVAYVIKNVIYDLPAVGRLAYLQEARKIVPKLRYRDIRLRRGAGGIRPQIVDLTDSSLKMGDATFVGENAIFNTTPSPGASVCLANAKRDALRIVRFFNNDHKFKLKQFEAELG